MKDLACAETVRNWEEYWNEAPQVHLPDPLKQVGKTVGGEPIAGCQVDAIVDSIIENLQLCETDTVLDLCCGNGLLTARIAAHCQRVTGVDFSAPLLSNARLHYSGGNIDYVLGDVCDLPAEIRLGQFDKIYLYEGWQHLDVRQAELVLEQTIGKCSTRPPLYIGSIPDADRKWSFYDTPSRREDYQRRRLSGTEAIGSWWEKRALQHMLERYDYVTTFRDQDPSLHGAHYRFDIVAEPVSR